VRWLVVLGVVLGTAGCNSLLGIDDLSGGAETADADVDAADEDAVGVDAAGGTATVRFLLMTPDIYAIDADATAQLYANGSKLADASYGNVTPAVELPLSATEVEIRATDGMVLRSAPLTFDEVPTSGERTIGVISGLLGQSDTMAADHVRVTGFNEALLNTGDAAYVKVVHAIADRPHPNAFAITYPGHDGKYTPIGSLGGANGEAVPTGTELRVRLGQDVSSLPGTEEVSFTLPPFASDSKVLLVAGGLQHGAEQDRDPGLTLRVVRFDGAVTTIRLDPSIFFVNFLVDWENDVLSLSDAATGAVLSGTSSARSQPMIAFVRPDVGIGVRVDGVPTPFTVSLPELPVGSQVFVALTGYQAPSGGPPGAGAIVLDDLDPASDSGFSSVAFVRASPDSDNVTATYRDPDSLIDYPIEDESYGSVVVAPLPVIPGVQIRIFESGNSTPLRTFDSEIEGRRQITVLSGVLSGSPETLRTTNVDMRSWPWQVNAPSVGH
jgi:hypothetical protein